MHHDDPQKMKHREAEKPRANQSRDRHPTPYAVEVEHYRHEGDPVPEDDDDFDDFPRGRSSSSAWTPTRTRAPTPHPRASDPHRRDGRKTVQWAEELEQESPEQKSAPAPAPSKKKSAMKPGTTTKPPKANMCEKEEGQSVNSSEAPAKQNIDDKSTSQDFKPCNLRRGRRSSIPRPKFAETVRSPAQIRGSPLERNHLPSSPSSRSPSVASLAAPDPDPDPTYPFVGIYPRNNNKSPREPQNKT